jgi:NitT/TauT family transport system ATP-binding protein
MIKLQNIHYQINNKVIFRNLQLNFVDKKINCILGPSGSGKTTLLNIIAKIIKPQMGKLLGVPKNLSYVFQEERLIPELTVYQNLKLVLSRQYHNQPQILDTQINKYLELVALIDTKNLYPHELSGSMRQRLALVRAFAYRAEVLIMDEPFGGIDIMMKQSLITDLIKL